MKKSSVIFFVLVCISCGNKKQPEKNNSLWDVREYIHEKKDTLPQLSDWYKFENEVFQSIENIEKSDSSNRHERIEKFISYAEKVDGAVSEAYSNFSFEYADKNYVDFFSSLEYGDTLLVGEWAKCASLEVMIIAENQEKNFMNNFSKQYLPKISKLPINQQEIAKYYLAKLNEYSTGDWLK